LTLKNASTGLPDAFTGISTARIASRYFLGKQPVGAGNRALLLAALANGLFTESGSPCPK
jgi:hypothetical protein